MTDIRVIILRQSIGSLCQEPNRRRSLTRPILCGVSDAEPSKPAVLYCPHCKAGGIAILSVADDYRTIKVKCKACLRESRLAFPPIGNSHR
jgi:hypothetical protein